MPSAIVLQRDFYRHICTPHPETHQEAALLVMNCSSSRADSTAVCSSVRAPVGGLLCAFAIRLLHGQGNSLQRQDQRVHL